MKKVFLTHDEIITRCQVLATSLPEGASFFGVPRGGIAAAYLLAGMTNGTIAEDFMQAQYIVDDLVDSGTTRATYMARNPRAKFLALYDKSDYSNKWLVFPWEVRASGVDESATDIFTRLLQFIGEDPDREGLVDTPKRMVKMYEEITSGYHEHPSVYFKTFEENAGTYDQLIMLDPIPFFSLCEHHMVPFFGTVSIGYIPNKKFAGLSKFVRVVGTFSKRLQIQERLTHDIASCIEEYIAPLGVGVVIRARHLCMEMRGAKTHDVITTTSALKGVLLEDAMARSEFMRLIKN